MIRWCIEYQIAIISRRYRLFEYKIPIHILPFIGAALRYAICTHNHFDIGLIKSSPERRKLLTYLKMCMLYWWNNHPISKKEFVNCKLMVKNENNINYNFKQIGNINDIEKYWSNEEIDAFRLTDEEIITKGGGIGNWFKSQQALWQSRNVLKIFIGTGEKAGIIIVKNIRMKMKVITENTKVKSGTTSNVMLKRVGNELELKNLKDTEFIFSEKMRQIAGRCDNIYGERTFNFCSHTTAALLLYNLIIRNQILVDPTPVISRYFSGIYNFYIIILFSAIYNICSVFYMFYNVFISRFIQ